MSEYGVALAVLAILAAAGAVHQILQAAYLPAIGLFLLSAVLFVIAAVLNR